MELKFKDAYEQYLIYIESRQKEQSKKTLKERFENKILPYFKDYDIYKLKELDYVNFQNFIESFNYSNNYKKNLHYLFTSFLDYCIRFYDLDKNVARLVGSYKYKNEIKVTKFYTIKEFKKIIKHVDNNIYKQFFNLMFFTGTRPGEAMALRFSDLSNRIIFINKTIDEHGNRFVNRPKTKSSIRKIEIDKKLYKDLLKLKQYYIKKYNDKNYDYYIFGGMKPLSPTTINRYKIKACKLANIFPIKLHEFRHSHATLLVQKKIMINEVSRRLGHSDVTITLNTYTHTDKMQEKRVVKTLNFLRFF